MAFEARSAAHLPKLQDALLGQRAKEEATEVVNILHVIDQLSMTQGGGAAKVCWQLAEEQARMGHKVAIVTSDWHLNGERPEGVALKSHSLWCSPFGLRVAPGMIMQNVDKGTAIHLHNYRTFPNALFAYHGLPYVLEAHGSMSTRNKAMDQLFWTGAVFKEAKHYIANSELEVPQYQAQGAKPNEITVIPPGIDWREFETLPERRKSDKKTILFLGRLHYLKGADILIDAFKMIKRQDVRLVIAGNDGGQESQLWLLSRQDDRISFVGGLYGRDKIQAFVDADLYVLPSRQEMFGVTVLESLACGTPVVVMENCGAVARGLPSYLGAVSPLSVEGLASTIEAALDRDLMAGRSCRREWARGYGWDRLAPKHIQVYEGILDGSRN